LPFILLIIAANWCGVVFIDDAFIPLFCDPVAVP